MLQIVFIRKYKLYSLVCTKQALLYVYEDKIYVESAISQVDNFLSTNAPNL